MVKHTISFLMMLLCIMTSNLTMAAEKAPSTISFDAKEISYEIGSALAFSPPTFNNPDNLFVTFSSSNSSVAAVDELSGEIKILGAGVTVITAISEETEAFLAGEASYSLTVTDPTLIFGASFGQDLGGFTEEGEAAGKGVFKNWWGWMRANGANKVETLTDCYLVSPEITLDPSNNTVSFTHKTMNFPNMPEKAKLMIREVGGQWNEMTGVAYPTEGQFDPVFSGDLAIPATYNGKRVQFAFKYITEGIALIWDFQNFAVRRHVEKKQESTISYDVVEVKYDLESGDVFVAPTLNNPDNLPVTYVSDNTEVATVDEQTGEVSIVGKGVVNITATSQETDEFQAGAASYTIIVVSNKEPMYGVKVAGVEINSTNADDILKHIGLGEGKMHYNAYTRTLTMENVTLDSDRKNAFESLNNLDNFTLELIGDNVIIQRGAARSMLKAPRNTITGSGSLEISSPLTQGIFVDQTDLEITGGCTVIANGSWGICSDGNIGTLTINASRVIAQGDFGSICDFKDIKLIDCAIISPEETTIREGKVVYKSGGTCSDKVIIDKVDNSFDITINGIKVTNENASDILGNKTAVYEAQTKTLYLENAVIDSKTNAAIIANSDININLSGENKIVSEADGILLGGVVMMQGKGSLNVQASQTAVSLSGKELTISEIGALIAKGNKGIVGVADSNGATPKLRILASTVKAQGKEMSLGNFNKVTMTGCHIFTPENCVIENGTACIEGKTCTEEVVIDRTIEYPLYICGEVVTSLNHNDVFGDGKVSFDVQNKLLTIDNFNFVTTDAASGIAVQSAMGPCTIVVKGDNVINTPYIGVICSSDVEFIGDGTLDVTGTSGGMILGDATVTITEGVKMKVQGDSGISSLTEDGSSIGVLVLKAADLSVTGKSTGSIFNLTDIELHQCGIIKPSNAVIKQGNVLLNNGICREELVFAKKETGIDNELNSSVSVFADNGFIRIQNLTSELNVAVYDMSGKAIYKALVGKDTTIDVAPGIYFVVADEQTIKVVVR